MVEQATREETDGILSKECRGQVFFHRTRLSVIIEMGTYHLVYKDQGRVAGWIMIGRNTDYFTGNEIGFIYDVYVHQEYRGRGQSKKLVEAGITALKGNGYEEVRLNVFDANFAKGVYEKMGFKPLQTIMVYKLMKNPDDRFSALYEINENPARNLGPCRVFMFTSLAHIERGCPAHLSDAQFPQHAVASMDHEAAHVQAVQDPLFRCG